MMQKRIVTLNSVNLFVKCTLKYVIILYSELNFQKLFNFFEMRPSLFNAQFICAPPLQVTPMHAHVRMVALGPGYTRDWLPAYSFVVRAWAMVLTGERTLSDTSGARQYCPRARQTAADKYVYGLSGVLKNRLQRAHQNTHSDAKLRHSPGMPAAEKHKLVYETPNYVISHAAARWYHCTIVNYRDSSVRGYHDKTVFPCGVSPCPCSYDKTVCGQPVCSAAPLLLVTNTLGLRTNSVHSLIL
jgi:hypothetical protein